MPNYTLAEFIERGDTDVPFDEGVFFSLCRIAIDRQESCIADSSGLGCASCPLSSSGHESAFSEIGDGRDTNCAASPTFAEIIEALQELEAELEDIPFQDGIINSEPGRDNKMFLLWDYLFRYQDLGTNPRIVHRLSPILERNDHLRERFDYVLGRNQITDNDLAYYL